MGIAMITSPRILFLDEPTSGEYSQAAATCLQKKAVPSMRSCNWLHSCRSKKVMTAVRSGDSSAETWYR